MEYKLWRESRLLYFRNRMAAAWPCPWVKHRCRRASSFPMWILNNFNSPGRILLLSRVIYKRYHPNTNFLRETKHLFLRMSSALLKTTSSGLFFVSILTSPGCIWNCDRLMYKRLVSARDTLIFLHKLHCFGWFQEGRPLRGKKNKMWNSKSRRLGVLSQLFPKCPNRLWRLEHCNLGIHSSWRSRQQQDSNLFPPFTALSSDGDRWSDCLGDADSAWPSLVLLPRTL